MKVKNVIKGLASQYNLEAVHIITPERVLFSGDFSKWSATSVSMLSFKKEVENLEVIDRLMFNNRAAFIFVPELDTYYPVIKVKRG